MRIITSSVLAFVAALSLTACNTTTMTQTQTSAPSTAQQQIGGSVNVGYIAVKAGFDIESRIGHMPSSSQIGWLYENYNRLQQEGKVQTGAQITVVAYGNNNSDVIWSDQSISNGMRRASMPKSVMRATDVICARVTGYRIINVENVQISRDGTTSSWCESEFAQYVNAPWMQGEDGGYGFSLILEKM